MASTCRACILICDFGARGRAAMGKLKSAVKRRRRAAIGLRLAVLGAFLLVAGFGYFIWLLPEEEVALDRNADGIVVLTGGTSPLSEELRILFATHGHRVFITVL